MKKKSLPNFKAGFTPTPKILGKNIFGVSLLSKRGFTLIELIVSITIFTLIMTVSIGSILGIFDSNRKSRSLKAVMTNLNLVVESMSREMRFGRNYHCGAGTITIPQNCASGGTFMSFLSTEGVQVTYRLSGTALEREVAGGGFQAVTAPEVVIDDLDFYTLGAGADGLQPKVIIKIKSHAGTGKSRSDFTLQTLVTQRPLDQ
jgi:prepilin-type N-terminal cleavage/methylation domain-containing protein